MSKEGAHNKPYHSGDILRYLRGLMSASEMHQLEKAAMEDPFLADAIAGMDKHLRAGGSPETDLRELQQRLATGTRRKKPVRYLAWRAAAACVLLAGAAAVTYYIINPGNQEKSLVTVENLIQPEQEQTQAADTGQFSAPTTDSSGDGASTAGHSSDSGQFSAAAADSSNDGGFSTVASARDAATASRRSHPDLARKEKKQQEDPRPRPPLVAPADPPQPVGIVRSIDSPATSGEKAIAAQLGGRAAGVEIDRSQRQRRDIKPEAETASPPDTGENAVAGYNTAKKTTDAEGQPGVADPLAAPVEGWKKWQEYIDSNKRTPPADAAVHGNQVLSFIVHKNGKLSDFRIVHSLSPWHDAESIRLVREGPAWTTLKGKQQVATITIRFSAP